MSTYLLMATYTVFDMYRPNSTYLTTTENKKVSSKYSATSPCCPHSVSLSSAGLDFGAILVKPSPFPHRVKLPLVVLIHGLYLH